MAGTALDPNDPNVRTIIDPTNPASLPYSGQLFTPRGPDPNAWPISPALAQYLGIPALQQAFQGQYGEGSDSSLMETDRNKAQQIKRGMFDTAKENFTPEQSAAYQEYLTKLGKIQKAYNAAEDKGAIANIVGVLGSLLVPGLAPALSGATGIGTSLARDLLAAGVGATRGGITGGGEGALLGGITGGAGSALGQGLGGLLRGAGGAAGGAGATAASDAAFSNPLEAAGSGVLSGAGSAIGSAAPDAFFSGIGSLAGALGGPSGGIPAEGTPTEVSPLTVTAASGAPTGIDLATILGNVPGLVNTPAALDAAAKNINPNDKQAPPAQTINDIIKIITSPGLGINLPTVLGGGPSGGTPDPFTPKPAPGGGPGGPGPQAGPGTPAPGGTTPSPSSTPALHPAAGPQVTGSPFGGGGAGPGGLGNINLKGSAAPDIYPWSTVV